LQGTRNGHVSCAFHHFTNALGLGIKITVDGSGQECPPETENALTAAEFRRIALSMPEATEGSHFGSADFRVGGKIFATLALEKEGYGVLLLTPEEQAGMVADEPTIFSPVPGGLGPQRFHAGQSGESASGYSGGCTAIGMAQKSAEECPLTQMRYLSRSQ
jgi:hypothetical protein